MKYILLFLIAICSFNIVSAQDLDQNKISNRLLQKLEDHPDDFHHVYIMLYDQVDVLGMDVQLYQERADLQERAEQVITTLQQKAFLTQAPYLELLGNSDNVIKSSIQNFWITNVIFAKATKEMIATLSQDLGIEWLDLNSKLAMVESTDLAENCPTPTIENGVEPGLVTVNAPALWEMGYTGYGTLAMGADTGIDPTHPALSNTYRGLFHPGEECWFQYDSDNTTPFDCDLHGTHTLGTIIGLDRNTNDTIGVAYNAQWIGSIILCSLGTIDNIASFQWALDPDNDPTTNDDMPDVINNSWWDPEIGNECNSLYVNVLNALEAAGVAPVFSAGNAGPDSLTITPPHNINTSLVNSFTVCALDGHDPALPPAYFSSRGPSYCGGTGSLLIKPEVSAPGVDVRSCIPGNEYTELSGTSMAAPHVCGVLLLLKEAFPYLTGAELKLAVYNSCHDYGTPGEDNDYGMGVIDALSAFNYLVDQGHEPVSPIVNRDLIIFNSTADLPHCGNTLNVHFQVENAGTDVIESFFVDLFVESNLITTIEWNGNIAPGERMNYVSEPVNMAAGDYNFFLEVRSPNGMEDQKPLNNKTFFNATVNSLSILEAFVENGEMACENANVVLHGDAQDEHNVIYWYDDSMLTNLLGTGEALAVPINAGENKFYGVLEYHKKVGMVDNSLGDEFTNAIDYNKSLTFDCKSIGVKLESVKVYVEELENFGSAIISLLNSEGNVIKEKIVSIQEAGEQRLQLNFNLPQEDNLRLKLNFGNFLRYTPQANYPYDINNAIVIKGYQNPLEDEISQDAYYYFYDWEVSIYNACDLTELSVDGTSDQVVSEINLTNSVEIIDINSNIAIDFNVDNPEEWVNFSWDFGDGTIMEGIDLANVSHLFTEIGIYHVIVTGTDANNCMTSAIVDIEVVDSTVEVDQINFNKSLKIYPNPTSGNLNIEFSEKIKTAIPYQVVNLLGHEVAKGVIAKTPTNRSNLSIETLEHGIFYIMFELNNKKIVKKIVKLQ